MPANTSQDMYLLAVSPYFQHRLSILLNLEGMVVLREATSVTNHGTRVTLAKNILYSPDAYAATLARELVSDTNLLTAPIVTNADGTLDSSATDAAIRSQIATCWNAWCGV